MYRVIGAICPEIFWYFLPLVSSRLIQTRHSGRPIKLHSLLPAGSASCRREHAREHPQTRLIPKIFNDTVHTSACMHAREHAREHACLVWTGFKTWFCFLFSANDNLCFVNLVLQLFLTLIDTVLSQLMPVNIPNSKLFILCKLYRYNNHNFNFFSLVWTWRSISNKKCRSWKSKNSNCSHTLWLLWVTKNIWRPAPICFMWCWHRRSFFTYSRSW